jgi:hypothetical protein
MQYLQITNTFRRQPGSLEPDILEIPCRIVRTSRKTMASDRGRRTGYSTRSKNSYRSAGGRVRPQAWGVDFKNKGKSASECLLAAFLHRG